MMILRSRRFNAGKVKNLRGAFYKIFLQLLIAFLQNTRLVYVAKIAATFSPSASTTNRFLLPPLQYSKTSLRLKDKFCVLYFRCRPAEVQ